MSTIADIYNRYRIPHRITDARGGWVETHCPFCQGSADFHLGYSIESRAHRCWRCGFHLTVDVLMVLCRIDRTTALDLYRTIGDGKPGASNARSLERDRAAQARVSITPYRRPSNTGPMTTSHRSYLAGRGFDPERIEAVWGVEGTGPVSYLDHLDYRHRLFIPILWEGREVSFQARDVTGKSELKYKACPPDREAVHHKGIVYAHPDGFRHPVGIVVEGVTDAWRLGIGTCAVFGTQYKTEQVLAVAARWGRVAVVFDDERAAQARARRLAAQLRAVGCDAIVRRPPGGGDPGGMAEDDVRCLVGEIARWGSSV